MNLKKLYKILYKYVADGKEKTPSAELMKGVYHDRGDLVACNTHTLFVIHCDGYALEYDGLIIDRKGNTLKNTDGAILIYPDYRSVMPDPNRKAEKVIGKEECKLLVKACNNIPAVKDQVKQIYIRVANTVNLDPKIILDVAEAFKLLGEEIEAVLIYTERDKQFKPVVFTSGSSRVVVMPHTNMESILSVEDALEVGDLL